MVAILEVMMLQRAGAGGAEFGFFELCGFFGQEDRIRVSETRNSALAAEVDDLWRAGIERWGQHIARSGLVQTRVIRTIARDRCRLKTTGDRKR
jgi:hypothetical protein